MLQRFCTASDQMVVLDMAPNEFTIVNDGPGLPIHGWRQGDAVPARTLMSYSDGATACENDPDRYRPDGMTDAEHEQFVAGLKARKSA